MFTDFESDPVGLGAPTGWTEKWAGTGQWGIVQPTTLRYLYRSATLGTGHALCEWTAAGSFTDFRIVALMNIATVGAAGGSPDWASVAALCSGLVSVETGYIAGIGDDASGKHVRISKLVGGVKTIIAKTADASLGEIASGSVNYWIVFEGLGTALRCKVWQNGTQEPSWADTAKAVAVSDASIASGTVGAYKFDWAYDRKWHNFEVTADPVIVPLATRRRVFSYG